MPAVMHQNQISTSPELVRCLVETQVPHLTGLPISPVPGDGTDNALYRIGEKHVARLPIIDWAVGNEADMRPWLPRLRDHLSVQIPMPEFYGQPACGYDHEWTLYPWILGEQAPRQCSDPLLARNVADFILELRTFPIEGAPSAGRSPHGLDADVRKCLGQLRPEDRPGELLTIWEETIAACDPWDGRDPVWIHGDLAPTNMLVRDGQLAAVIDWSAMGVGDRADDLRPAWNMFTSASRKVFQDALSPTRNEWLRAKARAFAQASFQLPYYRHSNPGLAAQAKYVFGEMLAEAGLY